MIRRNSKLCKLFSSPSSDLSYSSFISSYNPALETCPYCRSTGNCIKHAYYHRNVIHTADDRLQSDNKVKILRVMCNSCHHTHAVLPDFFVPYRIHSLIFIVDVLLAFYKKYKSINALCKQFHLSKQLFRLWRSVYLSHRFNFLGSLNADAEDIDKILVDLYSSQTHPFLRDFFLSSGVSLLQSHANDTANSGQFPYWNVSDKSHPHYNCPYADSLTPL